MRSSRTDFHAKGGQELDHASIMKPITKRARVPIYVNGAAQVALPPTPPNLFVNSRRQALGQADVIMIIGTPFDFRLGYGQRLNPQAKVIQAVTPAGIRSALVSCQSTARSAAMWPTSSAPRATT